MEISKSEYDQCIEEEAGFCTECDCFTTYGIEPDDEYYPCEICDHSCSVFGIDVAIELGLVFAQTNKLANSLTGSSVEDSLSFWEKNS